LKHKAFMALTLISRFLVAVFLTQQGTGQIPLGTHVGWNSFFHHGFRLRPPPWRLLLDFEAHALPMASVAPGYSAEIFAFPLWCLILPSLIAPAIWLRTRLKERRQARGFDVALASPVAA
jgi:hypothetical protein